MTPTTPAIGRSRAALVSGREVSGWTLDLPAQVSIK